MAFKMKGMYFGEGTGSALKWAGAPVIQALAGQIGKKHGIGDKQKRDNKNKEVSIPRVNWDLEDIEMTEKIDESKKAVNRNKDNNPDPKTVEHTPQTVEPPKVKEPQTVEPVEEIKPQAIDDKKVDVEENKNSKEEEQEKTKK